MPDQQLSPRGTDLGEPAGDAWRPKEIARLLDGVTVPWCVAGGWAPDLFRSAQARDHEDLEIAVPAVDCCAVRNALAGYRFEVVGKGRRWPIDSPACETMHQTWVSEPATGVYRVDVFREPGDGAAWTFPGDSSVRMGYDSAIRRSPSGTPCTVPEIALPVKAKHARPKDDAALAGTLPLLEPSARARLRRALRRVHPGHPWAGLL
jgi:hypothetical protein